MAPSNQPMAQPLDCNQPFVFDVPGQRFTWCGVGLCDVQLASTINGTMPHVYQVALINATIDEDTPGDITVSEQTLTYFDSAIGQSIPGDSTTDAKLADTNLPTNLDGSPAPNGMVFIVVGMACRIGRPYARATDTDDAKREYHAWTNPAPNGNNYGASLIQGVLECASLKLEYSDTGLTQYLGSVRHWISMFGDAGPVSTRNGMLGVIGFVPYTAKYCIGGPDSNRSVVINLSIDHGFVVEKDDASPPDAPVDGILYIPVEIVLFGSICCVLDILKSLACVAQPGDVNAGGWAVPQLGR